MQLEFHQLERRWEHLRVRHPQRQRRLLASLAEAGQQTPIVVVTAEAQQDRYVLIDGYKRVAALEQLGRDTVEAVVWPMSEAAAVLLDRSLRLPAGHIAPTSSDTSRRVRGSHLSNRGLRSFRYPPCESRCAACIFLRRLL